MDSIKNLKPQSVWSFFEEITKVPRPSKKEEKIIQYLLEFGKRFNLPAKKDAAGNVLITKPATKGKENTKTVVLQSHIDMVCEKNNETVFNFDTDAIQAYIDGDWVKAKGTTLGADDGIGMAAQLALLASTDVEHGPIECLFTIDEETGLTGAFELKEGFFTGKILLNLDSEDEGEIFIGCAGGIDTAIEFDYKKESVPANHAACKLLVSGLTGGHSGDDINKGFGNSNKILNRFIWENQDKLGIRLSNFDGGNLRNAIPREAFAIITLPEANVAKLTEAYEKFAIDVKFELSATEPNLKLTAEKVAMPQFVIDADTQHRLLNALYACPHGVIAMSMKMPGLVETSTNLASVKVGETKILVTTSQRSSVNSSKNDIANMVRSVFALAGASKIQHGEGYPGWAPNPDSEILKIAAKTYTELFGVKPHVRAIHAGLECGLFLEKYPELDMISFGPTLRGVHSPDERLEIKSVPKFWDFLVGILRNI